MNFLGWREHFEAHRGRPLPALALPPALPVTRQRVLAWSLARFQVGEAGEGRIAREIYAVDLPGIDDDYRRALGRFVEEEGRHARILAAMVRLLGASLLRRTWSERLFVFARRLCGVRIKLLVLLAAEVVGLGFYVPLAAALPGGALRNALEEIADDERAHLRFHRDFFRTVAPGGWRRGLLIVAWALVGAAASAVVLWDHRRTLRAFAIPCADVAKRLASLLVEAVRLGPVGRPMLRVEAAP